MTFFLVVLMSAVTAAGEMQIYIFTDPTFKTYEQCQQFAVANNKNIYRQAYLSYEGTTMPKSIYCLDKDQLKKTREELKLNI